MEGLTICTWRWGNRYEGYYVERLRAGLSRHMKREYRFGVFAPEAEDEYLTKIPGCFCRLRTFDPDWQEKHGMTGRIVCIDLDVVITGALDPLFDRNEDEDFTILQATRL